LVELNTYWVLSVGVRGRLLGHAFFFGTFFGVHERGRKRKKKEGILKMIGMVEDLSYYIVPK
jgi:hypothetical protein